jgi:hypothetical protein
MDVRKPVGAYGRETDALPLSGAEPHPNGSKCRKTGGVGESPERSGLLAMRSRLCGKVRRANAEMFASGHESYCLQLRCHTGESAELRS